MTPTMTGMAGRVAIALLLVLLAAGSVLGAAATLPGLANVPPAEETAAPSVDATADPSTEPSEVPAGDPSAEPPASREPTESPGATAPAAREAEDAEEDDTAPSLANLERIVAKLRAAGIVATTDELAALAAKVGVGGAVRVLLFADASGSTTTEILTLVESGKGWGVIAKDLDLAINPGLGSVMGNGKGQDKAAKAAEKAARAQQRAERKAGAGE